MSNSDREIADFYRALADRLDAVPNELPRGTQISDGFAAFLTNAVREIREDASVVARRIDGFDPKRRWDMLREEIEQAQNVQTRYLRS
jgi:hypothetical protein